MPAATERGAFELAAAIRAGELTSVEVVEQHIAILARDRLRLGHVVADRFRHALADAGAADAALRSGASHGKPLLGVPFTVKETVALAGMPNSGGLIARRAYRAERTATAVQRLIDAGAIPLGVTNTSELTLAIESDNPLYGRTNNPYDTGRTAGGSSGGEGAAVGSGGSPFGIGSDIAGSIRIPALFCGVFGHKPSAGLVPNTGLWPPSAGEAGRLLGTGPLTRRAADLMPLLRIIAGPDGQDEIARPLALGDPATVSLEGLQVTTVEESARLPMSREMRDARERAVGALLAAGATVRRVRLRGWRSAVLPYLAALQDFAGPEARTTTALLLESGEPQPTWRSLLRGTHPHKLTTRVALAFDMLSAGADQPRPNQRLVQRAEALTRELIDAIGDGVLLHPAHPRPAPRHGRTTGRPWLMTPAAVFNLAGVPVTEVPLGLSDSGLPVGVQVAAAHGADHRSIGVALELERVFGGWVPPRRPA